MRKYRHTLRAILLAGIMSVGFEVVWLVFWLSALALVQSTMAESNLGPYQKHVYYNESLVFQSDGTPAIQFYTGDIRRQYDYRDLAGNAFTLPEDQSWATGAYLFGPTPQAKMPWGLFWSQRLQAFSDPQATAAFMVDLTRPLTGPTAADREQTSTIWYLVHDDQPAGTAHFEGFSLITRSRIGYIGKAGFRRDGVLASERFAIPAFSLRITGNAIVPQSQWYPTGGGKLNSWLVYLVADNRLYEVNFREASLKVLFDEPDQSVVSANVQFRAANQNDQAASAAARGLQGYGWPNSTEVHRIVIRTPKHVVLLNPAGEELRTVSLAAELLQQPFVWYELAEDRSLVHVPGPMQTSGNRTETYFQLNSHGDIEHKRSVDLRVWFVPEGRTVGLDRLAMNAATAFLAPSPIFVDLFVAVVPLLNSGPGVHPHSQGEEPVRSEFRTVLVAIHLVSVVFAWLTDRRNVCYAIPWRSRVAWLLFVIFFGLPGWIGFLAHRRWPVLDTCPTCNQQVPMNSESCAACSREFPAPALKGIEVFA